MQENEVFYKHLCSETGAGNWNFLPLRNRSAFRIQFWSEAEINIMIKVEKVNKWKKMKTFSATMPLLTLKRQNFVKLFHSVPDPDPNPDPPDPHVFGPLGSGSTSQRYESGSGSFYHKAKILRKTVISTVLWLLFDFLSLKNDVKVPSKSTMQKNFF